MKKTIVLLIVVQVMMSCIQAEKKPDFNAKSESVSQMKADSSAHLVFKGVPIDGTLNEYVSKMKKSGFTLIGIEDGIAMLKGDFAGYKNCLVGVVTLKQKDLVNKITVMFENRNTWSLLSSNYFSLKKMLTEKYGEPSEVVEKFDSYSEQRMMVLKCMQLNLINANITLFTKLTKAVLS